MLSVIYLKKIELEEKKLKEKLKDKSKKTNASKISFLRGEVEARMMRFEESKGSFLCNIFLIF